LEERLRQAMLAADVQMLDELIADDLQFRGLDGRMLSKEEDFAAHRSGKLKLTQMTPAGQSIHMHEETAVVSVRMHAIGQYDNVPFDVVYRYTRVWMQRGERVQIVAGHMDTTPADGSDRDSSGK
jgi:hypothetical protein